MHGLYSAEPSKGLFLDLFKLGKISYQILDALGLQKDVVSHSGILPGYSPLSQLHYRYGLYLITLLVAVGIAYIYGALAPVFNRSVFGFYAAPIAGVYIAAIWSLPERKSFGEGLCGMMTVLFLFLYPTWPEYVSFLTSLTNAWLSPQKLLNFAILPLALIILSVSRDSRNAILDAYQTNKTLCLAIIVLSVMQIVTIPFASNPINTASSVFKLFAYQTLFMIVAIIAFRNQRLIDTVCTLIVLSAVFLGLVSIYEVMKQKVIWPDLFPASWIIQDATTDFILAGKSRLGQYRSVGPNATALEFAEYLAYTVPFALYLIIDKRKVFAIILGVSALVLSAIGIINSGSRLGIVGYIAAIGIYGLVVSWKYYQSNRNSLLGPAIITMSSVIGFLSFLSIFVSGRISGFVFGNDSVSAGSSQARIVQWAKGLPEFVQNPIGYGYGESAIVLQYFSSNRLTIDTYWLSVLLETGLIGFLALIVACYMAIKNTSNKYIKSSDSNLGAALCSLFVTFVIIKLVLSQRYNHVLIYFFFGIVAYYFPEDNGNKKLTTKASRTK